MTDWEKLIFELIGAGFSEAQIGEKIGVHGSTVNQLKMGYIKDPKHSYATRLIDLHRRCKDAGLIAKQNTELVPTLADTSH